MIWFYRLLLIAALPVALPALALRDKRTGKIRPPWSHRLGRSFPKVPGAVWIQAVSVGEVGVAHRLIREILKQYPRADVLLTATTATGLARARALMPNLNVAPFPVDIAPVVRRCLLRTKPRVVVLVETELWPELLHQCWRAGVPVVMVNARLSDRSYARMSALRFGVKRLMAGKVSAVLAQSKEDADRFVSLGFPAARVHVTGNIKYDIQPPQKSLPWEDWVRSAAGSRPILVAGSTTEGEEALLLDLLQERLGGGKRLFLVLAPRHPERFDEVADLMDQRGLRFVRRSHWHESTDHSGLDAFLLDTIGELARAYSVATVAFVGGGLAKGGHNPLEPAAFGVPVVSLDAVHNFRDAYRLLGEAGGAAVVPKEGLAEALDKWLDPAAASEAGARAMAALASSRGATARTLEYLGKVAPLNELR